MLFFYRSKERIKGRVDLQNKERLMDISLFLAKLFGFYLVIIGIAYFTRREFLRSVLDDFYKSPALVAVTAIINLFIGLLIVLSHNVWELNWKVIITVFGYLSLLKGILNLYVTDWGRALAVKFKTSDAFVYIGVISIALGAYLLYHGYGELLKP